MDVDNLQNLRQRGEQARSLMLNTPFPQELELAIASAYAQLCDRYPSSTTNCDILAPIHPDLVEDSKAIKMVYDLGGSKLTKNVPVIESDRAKFAIEDDEILTLARWAVIIEDHYSTVRGTYTPMDIEWAKDGENGN